jgi:hypothetical protein
MTADEFAAQNLVILKHAAAEISSSLNSAEQRTGTAQAHTD